MKQTIHQPPFSPAPQMRSPFPGLLLLTLFVFCRFLAARPPLYKAPLPPPPSSLLTPWQWVSRKGREPLCGEKPSAASQGPGWLHVQVHAAKRGFRGHVREKGEREGAGVRGTLKQNNQRCHDRTSMYDLQAARERLCSGYIQPDPTGGSIVNIWGCGGQGSFCLQD